VFLTGQDEIDSAQKLLQDRAKQLPPDMAALQLLVVPIYSALPPEQQMKAFEAAPAGHRCAVCCGAQSAGQHVVVHVDWTRMCRCALQGIHSGRAISTRARWLSEGSLGRWRRTALAPSGPPGSAEAQQLTASARWPAASAIPSAGYGSYWHGLTRFKAMLWTCMSPGPAAPQHGHPNAQP
jgi:hypothetical protein